MDVDSLWTNILGEIELEVSRGNFSSFFRTTHTTYIPAEEKVVVFCANQQVLFMLQSRYSPLIKNHLEKRLLKPIQLEFRVSASQPLSPREAGPLFTSSTSFESTVRERGLNPQYTFKNYAVADTNQMASAAAQAVASKPGTAYNPLFFWGPTGVGKTHLMQAIGQRLLQTKPTIKLMYCTGEEFTNEIIDAIRTHTTTAFKRRYRGVAVLLVDDIQFIAGRESVQMEFFHTFNSILHAGGQVILTSDNPPTKISKLEARLRSRFEGGLIVDIAPPNFELRTAILLTKAEERGIDIPMDIAKQLSASIEDVRTLEGTLLKFSTEQEREFDTSKIVSKLLNSATPLTKKGLNPTKAIELVAGHYGLKISQLTGISRKRQITEPRQLLMYILRTELGLPLEKIGELLGGRDHTTIMHGVEKIGALLPKHESFRQDLTVIRRLLTN